MRTRIYELITCAHNTYKCEQSLNGLLLEPAHDLSARAEGVVILGHKDVGRSEGETMRLNDTYAYALNMMTISNI